MKRIANVLRGRRREERGAVLVFTALSMVLLLWAGASGVNLGFSVYGSRQAQAMADTAALDLARYLSYVDSLGNIQTAQLYLTNKLNDVTKDNGSNAHLAVIPGYYANGTFKKDGFNGTSCQFINAPPIHVPGCNAVEVTSNQTVPQIFFGGFNVLNGHGGNTTTGSVSGSSVATQTPESAFSIGTYLVNINTTQSSLLNNILGPLDTGANITVLGYSGLATTEVTVAQLISASNGVLTPSNVMTNQLTASQWLKIWQTATLNADGSGSAAYGQLLGQSFSNSSNTLVSLCNLVHINTTAGQINCSPNNPMTNQGLLASVNVLQMITTEAELYNSNNNDVIAVSGNAGLSEPGLSISGLSLTLDMIQPPQVAYGPVGTVAETAQVQATLSMNLGINVLGLPVNLGSLSIPLNVASGQSTLSSMTCQDNSMQTTTITTTTQLLSTSVSLTLLGITTPQASLTLGGVSGSAGSAVFAGPAGGGTSVVPPTAASVAAGTNPLTVTAQTPITITPAGGINGLVSGLLTGTLDTALVPLLQAAGVSVAGAQVTDLNANCGSVSLVQ